MNYNRVKTPLSLKKINYFIIMIFFASMTFIPRSYTAYKFPLLILVIIMSIFHLIGKSRDIRITKIFISVFLLFICFGLDGVLVGVFRSNNISWILPNAKIFLFWGIIYLILCTALTSTELFPILFKVLVFVNLLVGIYNVLLFFSSVGVPGLSWLSVIDSSGRIGLHEGYVQITSSNYGTLIFTMPFCLTLFLFGNKKSRFLTISLIVSIISILLSGRRILFLAFLVLPVIYFIYGLKVNKFQVKIGIRIIISVGVIIIGLFLFRNYLNLNSLISRFVDGFSNSSDNIRSVQIIELYKGFLSHPIFGNGFGIGVSTVVRDLSSPWLYEVIYVMFLFNTGIIGAIIFISMVMMIWLSAKKFITVNTEGQPFMFALFSGFFCFFIANFSNPYLLSFEFLWTIFIIPAYYNYLIN